MYLKWSFKRKHPPGRCTLSGPLKESTRQDRCTLSGPLKESTRKADVP
jgi:hypothetical protein